MYLNIIRKAVSKIKIGEASKLLNVSIDTIRYYMDMELIVPGRQGNLYNFTEDTIEDLRWIFKLKSMGFSLKEIQKILSLRRISNWVEPQEIAEYFILLDKKVEQLENKIQEIQNEIKKIKKEKQIFAQKMIRTSTLIGVPLKALEYLRCPHCNRSFSVDEVQMNSRYIYGGKLFCTCGYKLEIKDGIIWTPESFLEKKDCDIEREKYKNLPASVLTMLQKSYNFILHRLWDISLDNKVILETDIDHFFYLYTHFRKIDHTALFIVTDPHPEILNMYKERIEYMKLDLDIVYLAADSKYPLKPQCIDIGIDYFTSNYREKKEHLFFYDKIEYYLKSNAELLGCYYLKKEVPKQSDFFLKHLLETGYQTEKSKQIDCPKEIGDKNQLFLYDVIKK